MPPQGHTPQGGGGTVEGPTTEGGRSAHPYIPAGGCGGTRTVIGFCEDEMHKSQSLVNDGGKEKKSLKNVGLRQLFLTFYCTTAKKTRLS